MAAPLKIAAKVEIDASQTAQGSAAASAAIGGIGKAADQTAAKLRALDNAADGLAANANGAGNRTAPLTAEGKALDDLRAKYNPLYATMRTYHQEVAAIKAAHVAGALSINEMTAAIERQRQAALSSMQALNGRNAAVRESAANGNARNGAQQANTANIAAQFQDIGVTAAMGMSPLQIALQQGTQLAAVIGSMERPAAGLAAAFTSIVSPLSLITIGAVAASAAVIQYFGSASSEGEKLEDILQQQKDALKNVRDLWGEAAEQRSRYGRISTTSASFGLDTSIAEMLKRLQEANSDGEIGAAIKTATNENLEASGLSVREFRGTTIFKSLQIDFEALHKATVAGRPDVLGLVRNLEAVGKESSNAGLKKMAADAIALLQPLTDLAEKLREAEEEKRRLFDDRGESGRLLSQGTTARQDAGDYALYLSRERVAAQRREEAFQAQLAELYARSPAERSQAARRNAAAVVNDESAPERRDRIEAAGKLALASAEKELADAQRDRLLSLDNTVASQKLELSLIGQTAGEAARLRMEHDLTARVREDAAKRGVEVDQAELDMIRQKAGEYGKLVETIAATNALRSQGNDVERLQAELSLVGASTEARTAQLATLQAEQRIRELGLATGSAEANQFRTNAGLISNLTETIKRQSAAWESWQSAGENAISNVLDKMVSGDFKGALTGLLKDLGSFFLDFGVKNPIKNSLFGSGLPTLANMASLVGGNQLNKSIGFTGANTTFSSVLGAANDNAASNSVTSTLSAGNLSAFARAVQSIESGGNYGALGPITGTGDRAYGAYQVMGANVPSWTKSALGYSLTPSQFLSDRAAQDGVFNHRFGGYVDRYGPSGAAQAWFGGPGSVGRGGMASDVLGTTGNDYVAKFNSALDQMTTSGQAASTTIGGLGGASTNAIQGLGTLGTSFNQFGQNLTNFFPTAPSSSGGGFLSSLFGLFSSPFTPIGGQATLASSGTITGLFDTGGWTGSMGRGDIAGFVHGQEFVVNARTVAKPGVRSFLQALNDNRLPGFASGGFVNAPGAVYPRSMSDAASAGRSTGEAAPSINVYVDNPRGDRDIEDAIDRGVNRGIKAYDKKFAGKQAQVKKRPYVRGQ